MKIFLDDFNIFSDLSTHLKKSKSVFLNVGSMALVWI
jgi:hypothetical protein